jgi:hypothetical protein
MVAQLIMQTRNNNIEEEFYDEGYSQIYIDQLDDKTIQGIGEQYKEDSPEFMRLVISNAERRSTKPTLALKVIKEFERRGGGKSNLPTSISGVFSAISKITEG